MSPTSSSEEKGDERAEADGEAAEEGGELAGEEPLLSSSSVSHLGLKSGARTPHPVWPLIRPWEYKNALILSLTTFKVSLS